MTNKLYVVVVLALMTCTIGMMILNPRLQKTSTRTRLPLRMSSAYFEQLTNARVQDKKCLVGLTTDSWNIGTRKYKSFLAVHGMAKKIAKANVACLGGAHVGMFSWSPFR